MPEHKSRSRRTLPNRLIQLVLAMVVIVPLIATPAEQGRHGLAALALEIFGILLLTTLLWRARVDLSRNSVITFLRSGANLPILLFTGLAAISCIFSPIHKLGIQPMLSLGTGVLLYFVVSYHFRRTKQVSMLLDTLLFVTIGASLLGFVELSSSNKMQTAGMFGDHQLFGSFMMLLLPVVGVVALTEKPSKRQLTAQIATVLGVASLLLSQARSAWLGAAMGLLVLGLLVLTLAQRDKRKSSLRAYEMVMPVALIAVGVAFFLLIWPQTSSIIDRMSTLKQAESVSTFQTRQHTWRGAMTMIGQRPLSGWGLGQYPYHQFDFTGDDMKAATASWSPSLGNQAHNLYLQTAAELGIPGALLLISIPVVFLILGGRQVFKMQTGLRRNLLVGSIAATVAFTVDAFASPSWQFGQVSMFLWLVLGLGATCMRSRSQQEDEDEAADAVVTSPVRTRFAAVPAGLALAVLLPTAGLAVSPYYPPTGNNTGADVAIGVAGAGAVALIGSAIVPGLSQAGRSFVAVTINGETTFYSIGSTGKFGFDGFTFDTTNKTVDQLALEIKQKLVAAGDISADENVEVEEGTFDRNGEPGDDTITGDSDDLTSIGTPGNDGSQSAQKDSGTVVAPVN